MSKSKKVKDPFAKREAGKYANPIPSREFILQHLEDVGEPVSHKSLCGQLKLTDEEQAEALRRRLIAMSRDGQVISHYESGVEPESEELVSAIQAIL